MQHSRHMRILLGSLQRGRVLVGWSITVRVWFGLLFVLFCFVIVCVCVRVYLVVVDVSVDGAMKEKLIGSGFSKFLVCPVCMSVMCDLMMS